MQGFSQTARASMYNHQWPGNVRELESAIERAVLLSKSDLVEATDFQFSPMEPQAHSDNGFVAPANMTLEEIERAVIEQTLKRTNGNKQAAAKALGIYRPRLYSKIQKYNLTV